MSSELGGLTFKILYGKLNNFNKYYFVNITFN